MYCPSSAPILIKSEISYRKTLKSVRKFHVLLQLLGALPDLLARPAPTTVKSWVRLYGATGRTKWAVRPRRDRCSRCSRRVATVVRGHQAAVLTRSAATRRHRLPTSPSSSAHQHTTAAAGKMRSGVNWGGSLGVGRPPRRRK